jgi:hypothetical protein
VADELGYHLVGVGEAHAEGPCVKISEQHVEIVGCVAGHYGCELWISRVFSLAKEKQLRIDEEHLAIVEAPERMLFATVAHPERELDIVAACGPRSWSSDAVVHERREELAKFAFKHVGDRRRPIALFDASAKVASAVSELIGGFEAAEEDAAGEWLRFFLEEMDMASPLTFWSRSSTSTCSRNSVDYVGVPANGFSGVTQSLTDRKFDLSAACLDHIAAAATFSMDGSMPDEVWCQGDGSWIAGSSKIPTFARSS